MNFAVIPLDLSERNLGGKIVFYIYTNSMKMKYASQY